jgi:hypothetical protein
VDSGEDPRLMALEQLGKGRLVASQIKGDERGIARLQGFHKGLRIRRT